jgi:3-oxoadipate enol-lactonase
MKLQLADFSIAYEDTGRGPPVLFVHGYPLGRRIFDAQLRSLLGQARLIVPDLRGHGDSDAPAGGYSIAQYARDCLELLDARGVSEPVVVCGLSMGGYVTFELLRQKPERVAGVVLLGTRASPDSPEQRAGRDADARLARDKGVDAIVDKMLPRLLRPATLADQPAVTELVRRTMQGTSLAGVVGDLGAMRDRPDSRPGLPKLGKPTLVVHGADDVIMTAAEAESMAKAIPGAELLVVPAAGHLVNVEQPTPVNDAISAFVRRVWAH